MPSSRLEQESSKSIRDSVLEVSLARGSTWPRRSIELTVAKMTSSTKILAGSALSVLFTSRSSKAIRWFTVHG